jgi:hypothetical protein
MGHVPVILDYHWKQESEVSIHFLQ